MLADFFFRKFLDLRVNWDDDEWRIEDDDLQGWRDAAFKACEDTYYIDGDEGGELYEFNRVYEFPDGSRLTLHNCAQECKAAFVN